MFRTVTDHLLDRLAELGVTHVFGVAGEHNLGLLDWIEDDPRLEFVPVPTSAGAGFAADGSARLRGIGVVCTSFGAGHLTVVDALAGMAPRRSPVLHLVGAPASTWLEDGRAERAIADIDQVLHAVLTGCRPERLVVSTDIAALPAPPATALPLRRPRRCDGGPGRGAGPTDAGVAVGPDAAPPPRGALTQHALWDAVAAWIRPGDLVSIGNGTCWYGMADRSLPDDVVIIEDSIRPPNGYALPALLGAALTSPDRRPVLLVGDADAQARIAELGTMIRRAIPALVLVVDNGGHTSQRVIHRPSGRYHDIDPWRWTDIPAALGASPARSRAIRVDTGADLRSALDEAATAHDRLTLIQAVTARLDVPPRLGAIARDAAIRSNRSPNAGHDPGQGEGQPATSAMA